jgi:predicted nucleotidyltransferase
MKYYPTPQHEIASKRLIKIFSQENRVMSILLTCSCARGKATKDSCLDVCIIVKTKNDINKIKKKFQTIYKKDKIFIKLLRVGKYSQIDLDVTDGKIKPSKRNWTSGPDEYELSIGNIFFYSIILFDRNDYFKKLQKKYLPYYDENFRKKRLTEVKKFMLNNLNHIPIYIERGLYFQAFKRLYDATREFLQALFIKNKVYPIAYDKWIKEQLVDMLGQAKLYEEFVTLYEIKKLESKELVIKADKLKELINQYL